jgi:hypothetical protein
MPAGESLIETATTFLQQQLALLNEKYEPSPTVLFRAQLAEVTVTASEFADA